MRQRDQGLLWHLPVRAAASLVLANSPRWERDGTCLSSVTLSLSAPKASLVFESCSPEVPLPAAELQVPPLLNIPWVLGLG